MIDFKVTQIKLIESYKRLLKHPKVDVIYYKWLKDSIDNASYCTNIVVLESEAGKLVRSRTKTCKLPLCPICAKKRSEDNQKDVLETMNEIEKEDPNLRYIHIVLTVKNVVGEELDETINKLNGRHGAFNRFIREKEVKSVVKGWYKAIEVNTNFKARNFQLHIHLLMAVDKSYFDEKKGCIDQNKKEWSKLWKKALKINYLPSVSVKKIEKCKDEEDNVEETMTLEVAIVAVTKQSAELNDYIIDYDDKERLEKLRNDGYKRVVVKTRKQSEEMTDFAVYYLHRAFRGLRRHSAGGIIKEKLAEIKKRKKN